MIYCNRETLDEMRKLNRLNWGVSSVVKLLVM